MAVVLGIDTGGTYTDAVLVDQATDEVLAAAKALTTRHDLSIGIAEAIAAVFEATRRPPRSLQPEAVDMVALSTTLATNAIAEGQGSPVCLLLIGYDRELMEQYGFQKELVTDDVVYLCGGHDVLGNEVAPLDEEAARAVIEARCGKVEAFAVSGYFGVRNPAHELRVRALVEELAAPARGQPQGLPLPVTCGHELTTGLNSVRRATTVALNARLIPLLRELIASVRRTLDEQAITAPLMVVKGDGSLVRAEWAMQRPIETILSGPAASAVGAWHLAGRRDVWVVDVGGTTTDIAALRDGQPRLNPEGARVGGWRTMVEAVDVHTTGLGGDSQVRLDGNGRLRIGPRRVVPLCLLAIPK
jgi:N-methylhydantoinase A/oxoprolinase/acetone carboxylase beta subunit